MFCEKCGKNIADDSIFCEFCGHKNKEEKTTPHKKEEKKKVDGLTSIKNETLKQMANHLNFLGYEIEKLDLKDDKEFVVARHSKNNNIIFWEMFPNFVMFKVSLTTQKKSSAKVDAYMNEANKDLDFTKVYYDIDKGVLTLGLEAVYIGEYVKQTFGQFYEIFEKDQQRFTLLDDFNKLFID